eukprot:Gb_00350 [translate_table: standard]
MGSGFNEYNANEIGEDEASFLSNSGTLGQERQTGNFARKDELLEYRLARESKDTREEDSEVYVEKNEWHLVTETAHFLQVCFLRKRHLGLGKDIYMYRGDSAFCSVEFH